MLVPYIRGGSRDQYRRYTRSGCERTVNGKRKKWNDIEPGDRRWVRPLEMFAGCDPEECKLTAGLDPFLKCARIRWWCRSVVEIVGDKLCSRKRDIELL